MEILNGRNVATNEVQPVTFADLIAKLEAAEMVMRAGYKAEALDFLNVAIGMVNRLEMEHGVDLIRATRSLTFVARNKARAS